MVCRKVRISFWGLSVLLLCFTTLSYLADWSPLHVLPFLDPHRVNVKTGIPLSRWKSLEQRKFLQSKSEIHRVIFVKVHKAASSTLQNILLRFAFSRNLSALLPARGTILSEVSSIFNPEKIIAHPPNKPFDILCNHVIYDEEHIAKYVSRTATRIAILREPIAQAISALKYFFLRYAPYDLARGRKKHRFDPINGLLNHPEDFYNPKSKWGPAGSHINNRMSVDLGFNITDFEASKRDITKIQIFLEKLELQFDVILISEYFEESMVLLRRLLRWQMKDIVHLKVNVAKQQNKTSVWSYMPNVTETVASTFRQWASVDYALYDHFLPIFLRKIEREDFFKDELRAFKRIQKDVSSYCLDSNKPEPLKIPEGVWTREFLVRRWDCKLMSKHEPEMVRLVRTNQLKRHKLLQQKTLKPKP